MSRFSAMVIGLCEGVADDLYGPGPMVGSLSSCLSTGFSPYLPSRIRAFAGSQAELVSGSRRSSLWSSSRPGLLPARSRCFPRRWTRLVDTAASVATFFGVRYAERPPDHDHRFGHGKGEAVADFAQAAALAGAALALAAQSAERLFFPEPIQLIGLGLVVIVASLIRRRSGRDANLGGAANWFDCDRGGSSALCHRCGGQRRCACRPWCNRAHRLGTRRPVFAMVISGYMLLEQSRDRTLEALEQLLDHG